MTGKNTRHNAFLRLVSNSAGAPITQSRYALLSEQEMFIGRDPGCQIVLDATIYRMVSRRHAVVRPLWSLDNQISWIICDLNSANGTFLNGVRLKECQELHVGDRISLGSDGPQLMLEMEFPPAQTTMTFNSATSISSLGVNQQPDYLQQDSVSFTQLFPIISTGKDLTKKAYLVPGILTVVFVVLMFSTVGSATNQVIVATYIAFAAYYFVYQLCGNRNPGGYWLVWY